MPELPEVETVRRALVPHLLGARISSVWSSGKPLRLARPLPLRALRAAVGGRRITELRRRAKYILLDTDGPHSVVVHLGMTGQLLVVPRAAPRAPHTHVVFALDGERDLRYVDPRRFGLVGVVTRATENDFAELGVLGLDPLGPELTAASLHDLARRTKQAVKTFLLDQRRVAGLGNIYVCEALFEAAIHPLTPANRLTPARVEGLRRAIVAVLERGLRNRGTTLRDYRDADGQSGNNQHSLLVYGREGAPCRQCGGKVKRLDVAARGTYFCPRCQKR